MSQDVPVPLVDDAEWYACLLRDGKVITYPEGAAVVHRGDPGTSFFAVLSGEVEVRLEGEQGQQLPLRRLGTGSFFGEMAILTGDPISADVVAATEVSVLSYPAELFSSALAECGSLRERVISSLANNLRSSTANVWNFYQRAKALHVMLQSSTSAGPLIQQSSKMRRVGEAVERLGHTAEPILIVGEAGTGKTFTAAKIHQAGEQPDSPFIVVDCADLKGEEAKGFIFGSATFEEVDGEPCVQGALLAYGALHLANRGTLVLKHVHALEASAQNTLARYLRHVGQGWRAYPWARVIATTTGDPSQLVGEGLFDAELSAALSGSKLSLPALRERRKDILPLAQLFLSEKCGDKALSISRAAEHKLVSRRYQHQNAAELREAVDLATLFAEGDEVRPEHIFTGPKEQPTSGEVDLTGLPLTQRFTADVVLTGLRVAVFSVFAVIVAALMIAPDGKVGHLANLLIWGLWWPALILTFFLLGRLWCIVCPLSTAGNCAKQVGNRDIPPPDWLKRYSRWFIVLAFATVVWSEHFFAMAEHPFATGWLLLSLMGGAVLFSVIFQRESWCRYICALGNLGAAYSLGATLSVRANPSVCATCCTTHECHKGSATRAGCPVFHHPLYSRDGQFCKLCFNCLKSCPHGSAKMHLRFPFQRIWRQGEVGGTFSLFSCTVFYIALAMLASRTLPWVSTREGFTLAIVASIGLGVTTRWGLHRYLSGDRNGDPGLAVRVALALLILAWGPMAAFHAMNAPFLNILSIGAIDGAWIAGYLPLGGISLLATAQLSAILVAGVVGALTLWCTRLRQRREQGRLSAWVWGGVTFLSAAYVATSGVLVLL